MAVAAALEYYPQSVYEYRPEPAPLVLTVPELAEDELVRHRAARFIGHIASEAWLQTDDTEALSVTPINSLYEAVRLAAGGNETAHQMVRMNASTDVIERTIKTGHVMKVDLMVDEAGAIMQHGQTAETIQANSLRYASGQPQIRARTEAETRNAFRIKHHYEQGTLDEYNFVVFSRAADDMSLPEMDDAGFFVDTMSCAIQVTSVADGRMQMESAFVAGVTRPGERRHDAATVAALLAGLGVESGDLSATDLLDTPLLIHKSLMPDGVLNLVERYDVAAGGTFFGEAKPRQDYKSYRTQCEVREASFKPTVDAIVNELLNEAPRITSQIMATERLHELSEKHMVRMAVRDTTINPAVFGARAASHIYDARRHYEQGNYEQAQRETARAIVTARSSSCPTAKKQSDASNNESALMTHNSEDNDEDMYGSLEFSCPKGHTNRRPRGKLIDTCQKCGISVRC